MTGECELFSGGDVEAAAEEHMGEFGSNQQEAISNAEGFSFFSKVALLDGSFWACQVWSSDAGSN